MEGKGGGGATGNEGGVGRKVVFFKIVAQSPFTLFIEWARGPPSHCEGPSNAILRRACDVCSLSPAPHVSCPCAVSTPAPTLVRGPWGARSFPHTVCDGPRSSALRSPCSPSGASRNATPTRPPYAECCTG
eukprot:scaffold194224_cov28-Tisochrysis_lutea.AAC.3